MHRHVAIISYTFGVALLNCRGGGVVLKFDVFSYCCAGGGGGAVCMQVMTHSLDNVPSQEQLNWWLLHRLQ